MPSISSIMSAKVLSIRGNISTLDYFSNNREVSSIMKYLLQFPSEAQVRDYIITKLEDDEPSDFIKYEKFEPYMLQVLMSNEFEPATAERLLDAFKILDP